MRLDVDVAGAKFDGVGKNGIGQPDDGGYFRLTDELVYVVFIVFSILGENFHLLGGNHGGEHIEVKIAPVFFVYGLADILLGSNRYGHIKSCSELDLIDSAVIQWIGHGKTETPSGLFIGQDEPSVRLLPGDGLEYFVRNIQILQFYVRYIELFGQGLANVLIFGPFIFNDDFAQMFLGSFFLFFQC